MNEFEPIFDAVVFFRGAAVVGENVEAAFGEEELMGGVVYLLTAKVPDVNADGFGVDFERPVGDVEAVGLEFVGVVAVVDELFDKGGFADAALTNKEEFGFAELAFCAAAKFS